MAQFTLEGAAWEPPLPTSDPLATQVLTILQDGRVHHRHALADNVRANVRQVRAAVATLRQLGWPIGFGAGGGYRLSWEPHDLDALERKYRRQALSEMRTLRSIRRARQRRVA